MADMTARAAEAPDIFEDKDRNVVVLGEGVKRRVVDLAELSQFRDLLGFLVWRAIKTRYAQSALGVGWAVIQPVASMLVYTIVFGTLMGVASDGEPYYVFAFVALVPWTYFSNAAVQSTASLSDNAPLLDKIYFPRMLLPLSMALARLVDFVLALLVLVILLVAVGEVPNWNILALPLLVGILVLTAVGIGLWLSALCVQFRDVKHGSEFGVRLFMYAAPVVYPAALVPAEWQAVYAINPLVGVIEGFRAAFLGSRAMPWDFIAIGLVTAVVLAFTGLVYFRRKERIFADVA